MKKPSAAAPHSVDRSEVARQVRSYRNMHFFGGKAGEMVNDRRRRVIAVFARPKRKEIVD